MAWPEIDPQIIRLLLDGAEALAQWGWHQITGDSASADAKKRIDAIRKRGAEAIAKAIQDELEQQAAEANLALQLVNLGPLTEHVLDAFKVIEYPPGKDPVPNLDLDIEQVDELPKPDNT